MRDSMIKKMVFTGLFIALTTIGTLVITFNLPIGYIHLGDPIVILAGILLGPVYGAIAAGLGSMLADLLTPYAFYAPATLIIKAALAFFVGIGYRKFNGSERHLNMKVRTVYHVIIAYVIVVGGYFTADFLFYYLLPSKMGGASAIAVAAAMVGPNSLQIGFGIVVSLMIYPLLRKPFNQIYNT